ncbi:guanylate kinase [Labilibaculum antarcticum]|uniref:Guanylate kinase n=1 Tax=Labilibaculum antarcticum TaxID=1717717 RepID=A0A1Y1CLP2_9BACT|nr:guanylate kinase [Labilibaculum antarcticum]BAX80963.1 guanylate kinase [Labilibaculum antarcticum]
MPGKLFIFSAPSGSGKTTIVQHLLKQDFKLKFSVSATSRTKRTHEIDGKDYHFMSAEEFKAKIDNDEFLEWEEVYEGCFYGTLKSEVEKIREEGDNVIFDVDVVGGTNIKKFYKEDALAIFIQPPSIKELENRLRNRNTDSQEVIAKRVEKFKFELAFSDQFDKVIVNDKLEDAFAEAEVTLINFLNQ